MDIEYLQTLMGPPAEEVGIEAYRDVWVVAESDGDDASAPNLAPRPSMGADASKALNRVSIEMMGKARELADLLGVYAVGVLLGKGVKKLAEELIAYGADTVYVADDEALADYRTEAYAQILASLVAEKKPEILLLGATDVGIDLAPRLAQRLKTGLASGCIDLSIDESERLLLATRPAYEGKLLATIANPKTRPQIATVRPGALRLPLPDKSRSGSVESIPVSLVSAIRTEVVETVRGVRERVPLEKARIIVSVGRGMGDQKGLDLAKELAEVLGAEVGGTRGALDEGLIDQAKWIGGAGGKRVKPDLYIACGISGAIQHYLGIKDAKYIVAINKNPRAPIFKLADVGIVGDVKQVLPALIAELKAA